jgi:hypothetical protein
MNSNFWINNSNQRDRENIAINFALRRYRYILDLRGEFNNVVIISRDRIYNADQNRVTG